MRMELNLASRPLVNHVPHVLLLGVLGLAAFVLTAWNASLYWSTWAQNRKVSTQVDELRNEEAVLVRERKALLKRLSGMDLDLLAERADAHNEVKSRKALEWHLMLLRLQQIQHWKVRLQGITPSIKGDSVALSLSVVAEKQEYLLAYIKDLELSPCFNDVYTDHEDVNDRGEYSGTLRLDYDAWCGADHLVSEGPRNRSRRGNRRTGRNRG